MFNDIQSILPKSLKRSGLGPKMEEAQIFDLFNEIADRIMPGDVRESIRPIYFNSRILTIASLSSFATAEMKQKEDLIIGFINEKMTRRAVRKLAFLT